MDNVHIAITDRQVCFLSSGVGSLVPGGEQAAVFFLTSPSCPYLRSMDMKKPPIPWTSKKWEAVQYFIKGEGPLAFFLMRFLYSRTPSFATTFPPLTT